MQTPKAKPSSLEVPQKRSPATPRTARQLKTPGSDPDSVPSQNLASRTPKDRSPKVIERRSPRSPAIEKKRPSRVSELESQLSKLQEELKKTKDQLNTSESWKRQAQQEAEDAKKQLLTMSEKLEESEQQLTELSASEDDRVHELRQISHDRDKAWQSELEAVQKQHSFDSAAYASAINEIHRLKHQLDMVSEAEATQTKHAESAYAELQSLRVELTETLSLVEKMKSELSDCRESEAEAIELVSRTAKQLETANATTEMLRSDGIKAVEAVNSLSQELEQSKTQVKSLEELISKLQADLANTGCEKITVITDPFQEHKDDDSSKELQLEVNRLKVEGGQLKAALEASEARYQEEYIQSTLQIRSAYEQAEHSKLESSKREAELGSELEKAKASMEELRVSLMDKETEYLSMSEENEQLNLKINNNHQCETDSELADELRKLHHYMAELKTSLLDKESQLQSVREQNEYLKMEIEKVEMERSKVTDEAAALTEAARTSEQEALMKLGYITEEADKSSRRAGRTADQLDAAQAANTEMEAELRRLKVQADQWRKAAEAATAILSTGKNGKFVERTGSLDSNMDSSLYSEDMDDGSPKKKNGNMLKKMGVLWKKGQK